MTKRPRVWLFAIEDTSVQLTWSSLPPGTTRIEIADTTREITGGSGSVTITGLTPGTTYDCVISGSGGATSTRSFTTLTPPPGRELARFATISDLHLGDSAFGRFRTITENPPQVDPFPIRATRAALRELTEWGADLLVVKGDVTSSGRIRQWEQFAELIRDLAIRVEVIPGNHDAGASRPAKPSARSERATNRYGQQITVGEAFDRFALGDAAPVRHVDLEGLRLVLTETDRTVADRPRGGHIAERIDPISELVASADRPVMLVGHHQPMPLPVPYYLPRGIPMRQSRELLRRIVKINPALFVSVAHTHRHRRWTMEHVPVAEVGSVKDYPGTWAGYVVHEGGIRQVVHRIASPDVLTWTDRTADAALGLWGRWSPGSIDDRCFTHLWPIRPRDARRLGS